MKLQDETIRKLGLERGASVKANVVSQTKRFDTTAKKWVITQTVEIELTRFDCWVEVKIARLSEQMVGPDANDRTWKAGRVYYQSVDGTKAILCLSPKVGDHAYSAARLTDAMMQAYISEFGYENILNFEEFEELKNSAAYTRSNKGVA